MHGLSRAIVLIAVVGLLAIGCTSERNGLLDNPSLFNAMYNIPNGAVVTSATFNVNVTQFSGQPVNLYRVTSAWEEMTVTWNSFGGTFDPTLEGSFACDNLGWKSADVTGLVQSWLDGTHANFGLLMDQPDVYYAVATYQSRESAAGLPPFLEVCYTLNGVETCLQMTAEMDAYIREYYPDLNWGDIDYLATGWGSEEYKQKQSLVRFDLEMSPPDDQPGCTRTKGYWKTHAGFGPQADVVTQYLPIWLGNAGGSKSLNVTNAQMAFNVLSQDDYGRARNGITKLYAQLLAARLNQAAGADITDIIRVLKKADNFLAKYDWTDWDNLTRRQKRRVLRLQKKLDKYNNGKIGPGHCDDGGDGGYNCDRDYFDHDDDGRKGKFKCGSSHEHHNDRRNCGRHSGDD